MGYAGGVSGSDVPTGVVWEWPFSSAPPQGWLLLDGSTYNYDDYPDLGALYGGAPGGTFDVEDRRNKVLGGASATNVLGSTAGADEIDISHTHDKGTLTTGTEPDHTHSMVHTHQVDPPETNTGTAGSTPVGLLGLLSQSAFPNHVHAVDIPEFTSGASSSADTGSAGGHDHTISGDTGSALSDTHDNRQATVYTNWIIKT